MKYFYEGVERLSFLDGSPTPTGCLLVFLGIALACAFCRAHYIAVQIAYGAAFFINAVLVILTFSRAAFLAQIVSLVYVALVGRVRLRCGILLAVFFVATILTPCGMKRVGTVTDLEHDKAIANRISIWRGACGIIADNFPNGVGWHEVGTHYNTWHSPENSSMLRTAVNTPLNIYAGWGVNAFLGYILLGFSGMYAAVKLGLGTSAFLPVCSGALQAAFHVEGMFAAMEHPLIWCFYLVAVGYSIWAFFLRARAQCACCWACALCAAVLAAGLPLWIASMDKDRMRAMPIRGSLAPDCLILHFPKSSSAMLYVCDSEDACMPGLGAHIARLYAEKRTDLYIISARDFRGPHAFDIVARIKREVPVRERELGLMADGACLNQALSSISELMRAGTFFNDLVLLGVDQCELSTDAARVIRSFQGNRVTICVTGEIETRTPSAMLLAKKFKEMGVAADFRAFGLKRNDLE